MNERTLSARVDSEKFQKLKHYLLDHNTELSIWVNHQIDSILEPQKQESQDNDIPPYDSTPAQKKAWMMKNLHNDRLIASLEFGCQEWTHLIKKRDRGDLQIEKLKAVAQ